MEGAQQHLVVNGTGTWKLWILWGVRWSLYSVQCSIGRGAAELGGQDKAFWTFDILILLQKYDDKYTVDAVIRDQLNNKSDQF